MKKILLTISLLLISFSAMAIEQKVDLQKKKSIQVLRPRSVEIKPTVYVDTDISQLTISMVSSDSYTMYVYDERGGVVYQGSVVSDGGRHTYFLPELESDFYTITIEGQTASYEGEFFAN